MKYLEVFNKMFIVLGTNHAVVYVKGKPMKVIGSDDPAMLFAVENGNVIQKNEFWSMIELIVKNISEDDAYALYMIKQIESREPHKPKNPQNNG